MSALNTWRKHPCWNSRRATVALPRSFLRRSLEAIFDIGRHIVAKRGPSIELAREYKSIAKGLQKLKVVDQSGQKTYKWPVIATVWFILQFSYDKDPSKFSLPQGERERKSEPMDGMSEE